MDVDSQAAIESLRSYTINYKAILDCSPAFNYIRGFFKLFSS